MAEVNVNKTEELKETTFTWRMENADLCWQKSGEELVSPPFTVDWLDESSWNLYLYPRGIQGDDSYLSFFIAQEKQVDAVTNEGAKFELYLLAADGSKLHTEISEGFLSMKKNGMFGYVRFVSWETLMDENGSRYIPDGTLTLCCRIWCEHELHIEGKNKPMKSKVFARTKIRKEVIAQQVTIDIDKSDCIAVNDIGTILQDHHILQFFVSVDKTSNHKSLTIGLNAEKHDKIKSAVCELVLADEKRKTLIWKNKYSWNDVMEWKDVVLSSRFPKKSEQYVSDDTFKQSFLYLACRFSFTNGSATQKIEKEDYGNSLDRFFAQRLSNSTKVRQETSFITASDALKLLFEDPIFHDAIIKGKTAQFKVHEMVVAPRSEVFKKLLSERDRRNNLVQINNEDDDTLQRVLYFLYTDTILDMHWEVAKRMYKSGIKYKIELLKEKCCAFIKKNLSVSNVTDILLLTKNEKDDGLKEIVKSFIIKNQSAVFNSIEWCIFSKSYPTLAGEYMMLKHKMK